MNERHRKRRLAPLFWAALILALAAALYYSNFHISADEYTISGAPAGFSGFRIVQISDLHARVLGEDNEKLVSAVTEQRPDIIAITGDLIDTDGQIPTVTSLLKKLVKIAPVYYVTGNHEYSTELDELYAVMGELGVRALDNEYEVLERGGDELVIAGVEDPNGDINMKTPEELFGEIYADRGEGAFTVLLAHRYDLAEEYAACGADAILSGHAHGGLVRLPFTDGIVGPGHVFLPEHTSGRYEVDGSQLIVSRGLGLINKIPRIFNPLHLPVIIFE